MALITKPYAFSDGQVAEAPQVNADLDTLYNLVNGGIDNTNLSPTAAIPDSQLSQIVTAGKVDGSAITNLDDMPGANWQDYSATSTIVGWVTPTKSIFYKKVGKTIFVCYQITGTSNSATTTFTLPYAAASVPPFQVFFGQAVDNGGTSVIAQNTTTANSAVIFLYKDMAGDVWTTSGTKALYGTFWYQSA